MTYDPTENRTGETFVDDRTPEEKAAGIAKMRAWLDNLPPSLAKLYADLKRMDKGQPRR
jgi:hypothetical protein